MNKKPYEVPEIVELGPAAELTQGATGCKTDMTGCDKDTAPDPF